MEPSLVQKRKRAKKKGFEKKTGRVVQPFYHPLSSYFEDVFFNKPKKITQK
jgi:hypothetical protein